MYIPAMFNLKNISHKYKCYIQVLIAGKKVKYQMYVPNVYVQYIGNIYGLEYYIR